MPAEASAVDWFREMLPVDIRVQTGSIILGSDATPMLLIGSFKRAEGKLEITDVGPPLERALISSLDRSATSTRWWSSCVSKSPK